MYCPYKYKYELIECLSKRYNKPKSFFNKLRKKQLYAIFYNTR